MRSDLGWILPMAEPARTMVCGSTMPRRVGVSPPPQTAPACLQPSAKPETRPFMRSSSANQLEPPTAACMATEIEACAAGGEVVDDGGDGVDADRRRSVVLGLAAGAH